MALNAVVCQYLAIYYYIVCCKDAALRFGINIINIKNSGWNWCIYVAKCAWQFSLLLEVRFEKALGVDFLSYWAWLIS